MPPVRLPEALQCLGGVEEDRLKDFMLKGLGSGVCRALGASEGSRGLGGGGGG